MRMKRFWYIVSVLLVSVLLVGGMLVAVLSSSEVETAAVRLVTAEFSRAFGTHARVGSITYRFPARVSIEDVYIEDRQGDTENVFVDDGNEVLIEHPALLQEPADDDDQENGNSSV